MTDGRRSRTPWTVWLFVGIAADGRKVKVSVHGDRDPGYGSTSKMLAEAAICLVKDAPDVRGGV